MDYGIDINICLFYIYEYWLDLEFNETFIIVLQKCINCALSRFIYFSSSTNNAVCLVRKCKVHIHNKYNIFVMYVYFAFPDQADTCLRVL